MSFHMREREFDLCATDGHYVPDEIILDMVDEIQMQVGLHKELVDLTLVVSVQAQTNEEQ